MVNPLTFARLSALLLPAAVLARSALYVDRAPDTVRPYIIEHYAPAQAVAIGQQIYRFPVTGASSGGTFSLLSTASPASGDLGVLPHLHQSHHENFFTLKGRFQLWAYKDNIQNNETQARILTVGDYGAVPRNTTHTFQVLDPDTEMVGVIVPGGFEELFFFLADSNYTAASNTPYVPAASNNSADGGGPGTEIIQHLQEYDVYAKLDFVPRRDFVNGTAPSGTGWHETDNAILDVAGSPYFVAKDYGPKYLNSNEEFHQIIQPYVTATTGQGEFTQGSITISRALNSTSVPSYTLTNHTAFEVLEGALSLTIGSEQATLVFGDVAFIPANTAFSYWSEAAFTKFMYVSAGNEGLDQKLLEGAESWGYPVFPTE